MNRRQLLAGIFGAPLAAVPQKPSELGPPAPAGDVLPVNDPYEGRYGKWTFIAGVPTFVIGTRQQHAGQKIRLAHLAIPQDDIRHLAATSTGDFHALTLH